MNTFAKIAFARLAVAVLVACAGNLSFHGASLAHIPALLVWVPLLQLPSYFFWLVCFKLGMKLFAQLKLSLRCGDDLLPAAAIAELLTLASFTFVNLAITLNPVQSRSDVTVGSGAGLLFSDGAYTLAGLVENIGIFKEVFTTSAAISVVSMAVTVTICLKARGA